ncbi:MAG: hypothetical protein A2298_02465 [Gammaproteobacteria bacterium RIFOXYB2_FULL_38_6]|nr:MAG: hypothetical protein A2298_02465 [Gammaproteobacteria bacterium RIFOXYB2_FULL_38_6]
MGSLTEKKLSATKKMITDALRYVKSYNGPSRIWFAYQDSLSEGCRRLSAIVSGLPVGVQTTEVLVDLLLRLDKKISGSGVDDSDGTVGDFMVETVDVLKEYAKLDAECIKAFDKLKNRNTSFGWEETLINKHV